MALNDKRKIIAITGSTGGLGVEICEYIASTGAKLILVDRSQARSDAHREALIQKHPGLEVLCVNCDLEDIESVDGAVRELIDLDIDVFIHNAGAYKIPRHMCSTGYENIFQINFVSPYYMVKKLLPTLRKNGGKAVAVGSIAHNYSKINENDVDFSSVKACSKVYGNAKRYLMFALHELFKNENDARLSIAHPGVTFTNITNHYHPLLFAIIKYPMKIIFMKPRIAARSINRAIDDDCKYLEWIGPRFFDVWGNPKKRTLKTATKGERERIFSIAEKIYEDVSREMENKK